MSEYSNSDPNQDPLVDLSYEYDFEHNITGIKDSRFCPVPGAPGSLNCNFKEQEYDVLNRLTKSRTPLSTGVHEVSYEYDSVGNRIEETVGGVTRFYEYDSDQYGNAIDSIKDESNAVIEEFYYRKSGAIASRTRDSQTTEYTYDGAGRLIRVEQDNNTIAEYTYDGDGRLIKIVEHLPGGTRTTIRLPMGTETAYERIYEGADTTEHIYIRANGMYIARETRVNGGPPQVSYYHGDHLGSTRAVSGVDGATLTYDPFGQLIESSGNDAEHLHRFTGKPQDSTGLYYYYARFYDPTIGRFISQDPAMDGLNWYAYAAGNPLKYVDPDGQYLQLFLLLIPVLLLPGDTPVDDPVDPAVSSMALDVMPIIGDAKGLLEAPIGYDLVSKERLAPIDRILGFFFLSELRGVRKGLGAAAGASKGTSNLVQGATRLHKHHILPREFAPYFARRGIDIDQFTIVRVPGMSAEPEG